MASKKSSDEIESLLFDVDQVDPSMLYTNEEDKLWLASLPELQREQIIAERLEKLKQAKDMSTALAVARRRSSVDDVDEKIYVPPMFRSPDYNIFPFFKDTCDEGTELAKSATEGPNSKLAAAERSNIDSLPSAPPQTSPRRSSIASSDKSASVNKNNQTNNKRRAAPKTSASDRSNNNTAKKEPTVSLPPVPARTSPRRKSIAPFEKPSSNATTNRTKNKRSTMSKASVSKMSNNNNRKKKPAKKNQDKIGSSPIIKKAGSKKSTEPSEPLAVPDDSPNERGGTTGDEDKQLLVYPFVAADRIELAAEGLDLCDYQVDYNEDRLISLQLESSVGRNHAMAFTQTDFDTLNPGCFVNDVVVGFWLLWISRNELPTSSNVLIFCTFFYTKLLEDGGEELVSRWCDNRNLDIFSKKIVMFPVNLDLHWSLCCIINLCNVNTSCNATDSNGNTVPEIPFIIHMDSLGLHCTKTISSNIRNWVMSEWKKRNKDKDDVPITVETMPTVNPSVTKQRNGFDCGLFTCRYAYAIYQSRFRVLSHKDDFLLNQMFHFPDDLVTNFRSQLRQLLVNLSNVYRLPYEDATFTWDESQESVVPLPVEFLTQLSDQEDYAIAFATAMQDNTNDFFLPVDTSAVQQNDDTSAVQQNDKKTEIEPMVHQSLITAIDLAVPNTEVDGEMIAEKPEVSGKRKMARTTVKDKSAATAVSSSKRAKLGAGDSKATSKDPFVGKSVAFGVSSDAGKELITEFGKKWIADAICYHLDSSNGHIVGTIVRKSRGLGKKKNDEMTYDVVWEFSSLGESNVPFRLLLDAHKEAEKLLKRRAKLNKKKKGRNESAKDASALKSLHAVSDDEVEMEAPDSDFSASTNDDEGIDNDGMMDELDWFLFGSSESNLFTKCRDVDDNIAEEEMPNANNGQNIKGLHWEYDGSIENEPPNKMPLTPTKLKPGSDRFFRTPIDSVMAIFPIPFWEVIVTEVNRYAEQKLAVKKKRNGLIAGYKWKPINLKEVMTYFGILIYGMLYPQTGRRMLEWWDSPYKNAWTKFMSRGRFLQICSVLHFSDNSDVDGMHTDSLHKIRPILNILKSTLSRYAILGSEHSFDEGTMACRSSYGRHLIVYNGMKPTGKFHFKIYMLCCAVTNLVHKIKIHTRNNSDSDNTSEQTAQALDEEVNKIDSLTLEMCRPLFHTGATVNMDNYYMSATCAIRLRENGVFCRGTIRSSRKFIPKSILFTPAEVREMPRGTQRCVVNNDHNMLAVGWIDNKAVHFISTADTTATVTVGRRVRDKKVDINAPIAIKNYNKYMGGVDRHDRLRSTFSLGKRHSFRKYYVKLFLFLCDIGFTNAWIYYRLSNPESTKQYGSRADFFEAIAEALVNPNVNWREIGSQADEEVHVINDDGDNCSPYGLMNFPTESCTPVPLRALDIPLSNKIKVCQVCHYEMRQYKWKSVALCSKHGVRLCTERREARQDCEPLLIKKDGNKVTDWSWTYPANKSCWDKFHEFYQPKGLFNTYFYFDKVGKKCKFAQFIYTSPLYQAKYKALGISVNCKTGRNVGMGQINKKNHILSKGSGRTVEAEEDNNEEYDSE